MECEKVQFKVEGISCQKCVKKIIETMKEVEGVEETDVELDSQIATMIYKPDVISVSEIKNVIDTIPKKDFKATILA